MKQYIQPFINRTISKELREEDTVFYYDEADELLAQVDYDEGALQSVVYYQPEQHGVLAKDDILKLVKKVQQVFEKEHLIIDVIMDFDTSYLVHLVMEEPRYKIPIHSTGMNMTISYSGMLERMNFHSEEVEVIYPDHLVSKEEAKQVLQQQPLMKLGISPHMDWNYVYAPDYNIDGVETDGRVRLMASMPFMQDVCFKLLPEVEEVEDLRTFLQEGRNCTYEEYLLDDVTIWEMYSEEQESPIEGDVYECACMALKKIVGQEYEKYHLEHIPANFLENLGFEQSEDNVFESYRFVYVLDDISFDFHAIEITVNKEMNHIQSIKYPRIPFDRLKNLKRPSLTLDEANAIAQNLVDATLTLERGRVDSYLYSFTYSIDYPTSTTQGNIHYIDAWTGEVHFVDTGFM